MLAGPSLLVSQIYSPKYRFVDRTACQVGSKVYRNPKYDPIHQPGYLATNGYTRGNSTNVSNKDRTDYETAHGDVHRSQSDFLSAKRELDTTVALAQNQGAEYLEMCKKNNSVSWP